MPDSNNQWPSEDEDFDTVTDAEQLRKEVTQTDQQTTDHQDEAEDASNQQDSTDNNEQHDHEEEQSHVEPEATASEPEGQEQDQSISQEETQPDDSSEESNSEPVEDSAPQVAHEDNEIVPDETHNVAGLDQPSSGSKKPSSPSNVIRYGLEGLLMVIVVILGLSVWTLKSDNNNLKKQVTALNDNPQLQVQRQTQQIINAVGKLIQLPSGETPTIATVTNASQAKTQSTFFDSAQNGDKVLMYVKAGEAILYRPGTNKIINKAPLTFTSSATNNATSSTSTGSNTTSPK